MADVLFEFSDLEISKDEVKASTDVDQLTGWLDEQNEVSQELAIMLGAMKFAPHSDTTRMARKLGMVNMSKAWIQKRLKQLGVDDERVTRRHLGAETGSNNSAGLKAHAEEMAKSLRDRNATIKAQNIELDALRQKLARYERGERRP